MKILLDENVSNKIKEGLIKLGIKEIVHINDIGKGLPDEKVFEIAKQEKRIVITGDDDFKADKFKYQIPIIWITPKARTTQNIVELINWILNHIINYNIDINKSFVAIRKYEYFIQYKNKDGIFGKIKDRTISFEKIKELTPNKR